MGSAIGIILFAGSCLIAISILVTLWKKWWGDEVTMLGIGMRLIITGIIGAAVYGVYQALLS